MSGKIPSTFTGMNAYGTSPRYEKKVHIEIPSTPEVDVARRFLKNSPDGVIDTVLSVSHAFVDIVKEECNGIMEITEKLNVFAQYPTDIGVVLDKNWIKKRDRVLIKALSTIARLDTEIISAQILRKKAEYENMECKILEVLEWIWSDYMEVYEDRLLCPDKKKGLGRILFSIKSATKLNKPLKDKITDNFNFPAITKLYNKS
jgi:hypothetical protein